MQTLTVRRAIVIVAVWKATARLTGLRFHLRPTTRLGWWAVRLAVASALFVVGMSLAGAGQKIGGEGVFDNLWLTVPLIGVGLTAVLVGVLAGVTAAFAIVRRGERSVVVFFP